MELYNKILEAIKGMEDGDIVRLWNEYCASVNNYDGAIMDDYEFEEFARNCDPIELLNRMYFGHDENDENSSANPNRDYFCFNGYANIISFSYVYNNYTGEFYNMDVEDLINYIIDENDALYNDDIAEILESMGA